MAQSLSDDQRATFAALADVLIPGAGDMPSASAADVASKWVDRALKSRADLADGLCETLDAGRGVDPAAHLAQLEQAEPARLEELKLIVAGSYYMSPRTRKRLGYPGQARYPIVPGEAEFYDVESLLAPVRARGFAYRTTGE
jgi:hypothetical protein